MAVGCVGCREDVSLPFEFNMAFQPIVDARSQQVWGYEALVRGPNGESALSVLDQVSDQSRYRFDQAARVMAIETAGALFEGRDLKLSINFLPNAVYEPTACIQKSLAAAKRVQFPHANLIFEFTENERIADTAHLQGIIENYRGFGFLTAIDDFGAGFSGPRLEPDLVKIDMELVRDIHLSERKQAIVAGVVNIARALDIEVIAEGVENAMEVTALRLAGVSLFQGFYFAKPALMELPDVPMIQRPAAGRTAYA